MSSSPESILTAFMTLFLYLFMGKIDQKQEGLDEPVHIH